MTDTPVLYGFDGSTYVRTVRIILAKKKIVYQQVPVNVLAGETRTPEHLARHPFGKVPVLDIDGMRLRETEAICRYLDDRTPEPSVVPGDAKDRALMTEIINMIGSYGYNAMLGGVAAYHLFPDFVGGKNEESRKKGLQDSITLLTLIMEIRGTRTWLTGSTPSIADYLLGPLMFYLALTPDMPELLAVPGMKEWWAALNTDQDFTASAPNLG